MFEVGASDEQLDRADAASVKTDEYFFELIAEKRKQPDDALLSGLLAGSRDDDDRLSDDELVTLASLLFAAGFETTTNLIGNGMVGLFAPPRAGRRAANASRRVPGDLRRAPAVRRDGSVEPALREGGRQLRRRDDRRGRSTIYSLLGGGNHDPSRFAEPDRLDLTRTGIRPLSFGGGVHFCLGAALARLEIETFFRRLFERFGTIELDGRARVPRPAHAAGRPRATHQGQRRCGHDPNRRRAFAHLRAGTRTRAGLHRARRDPPAASGR